VPEHDSSGPELFNICYLEIIIDMISKIHNLFIAFRDKSQGDDDEVSTKISGKRPLEGGWGVSQGYKVS
jgi:hypothetical protein